MVSVGVAALLSRVATLALMVSFDLAVDDYDTSSSLPPPAAADHDRACAGTLSGGGGRWLSQSLECAVCPHVEGLVVWDSVYFVQIALEGYEYEQSRAFFPGLPLAMRWAARVLGPAAGLTRCRVALAGLVITNLAFVASAVLLELLGLAVLEDPAAARSAALLYTFNPATVFHSAVYTEAPFACLSFAGCLALVKRRRNLAACLFAATCWVRSNGILHLVHLAFDFIAAAVAPEWRAGMAWLRGAAPEARRRRRRKSGKEVGGREASDGGGGGGADEPKPSREDRSRRVTSRKCHRGWARVTAAAGLFALRCATVAAPLLAVQWDGYEAFCGGTTGGWWESYAGGSDGSWAVKASYGGSTSTGATPGGGGRGTGAGGGDDEALRGPSYYARHPQPWCGVWRPFPNVYAYVQEHYWNVGFLRYYTLQQLPNFLLAAPVLAASTYAAVHAFETLRARRSAAAEDVTEGGLYGTRARPHLATWWVMTLVAATVMHVQVATRFLSVCPALYWFAVDEGRRRGAGVQRWICIYCITFALLGTLMFPTFYPWT